MKRALLLAILAAGALSSACTSLPPAGAPKMRVSADYEVAGDAGGIRAFVYGTRTVLEFDNRPLRLIVRDENGVDVPFEREGRYYRLARKLGNFSVWVNTRALSFTSIPVAMNPAATGTPPTKAVTTAPTATPVLLSAERVGAGSGDSADSAEALLKLSSAQLEEVRQAIRNGSGSVGESRALMARLDRIEAQIATAATAVVRFQFDTAASNIQADSDFERTLVPAAQAAERINVRGRTDSRVAGVADPKIALARALAARKFLMDRGVDGAKIKVFALPAGDFIAPANTAEGRALNRRVEIELVNKRFAELKRQAVTVARDKS